MSSTPHPNDTRSAPHGDIALVLGTRPEIIKLAPVIHALDERATIVHTGQHYDYELSGRFFEQLNLPAPHTVLTGIGGKNRGTQIATAIQQITAHFEAHRPKVVLVQGDTNAVSAGAQAANYLGIPVIHVEAGLRSYDRAMPEELNRMVTGVLADVHCAATRLNAQNLLAEGVDPARIAVTGNTIVEATIDALRRSSEQGSAPAVLPSGHSDTPWVLATIHRPENTDTPEALTRVLRGLAAIDAPVLFLAHPRTLTAIERWGLQSDLGDTTIEPARGHSEFLALASRAAMLVSDSGGVQEECTVLKKPLLVVRRSTERPEAQEAGFAQLITPERDIAAAANELLVNFTMHEHLAATPSPYGDGKASERIAQIARLIADGLSPVEAIAKSVEAV